MFQLGYSTATAGSPGEGDRLLLFGRASGHAAGDWPGSTMTAARLERPAEQWINCRMTHVFSLGHLMGRRMRLLPTMG